MATKRRGRPMKRSQKLTPSRTLRNRDAEILRRQLLRESQEWGQPTSNLSPLENLPLEILEQILFLSLEVNFPRASTNIARALSQPPIYHALILFAYSSTSKDEPQTWVEVKSFLPAEFRYLSVEEQIHLQRGITTCKWFDLSLLKSCLPVLCRLAIVKEWHAECQRETDLLETWSVSTGLDLDQMDRQKFIRPIAVLPALDQTTAVERHFMVRSWHNVSDEEVDPVKIDTAEPGEYRLRLRIWSCQHFLDTRLQQTFYWKHELTCRGVFQAMVIPNRMLTCRPWTPDNLELLKFCRQGLRFNDSQHMILDISAPALFEGMKNAILEDRVDVLLVLVEFYWHIMLVEHQKPPHNQIDVGRMSKPVLGDYLTRSIPLDLFHRACESPDHSSELLALLIRADIDAIPKDDTVLTAWALRAAERKDPSGTWLLHLMANPLAYQSLEPDGKVIPMFCNGKLRAGLHFPLFGESSFTEEIDYLICPLYPWQIISPEGRPCG